MSVGTSLSILHPLTNQLSDDILVDIDEVIYYNDNVAEEVIVCTLNQDTLAQLVSSIPNDIANAETRRYFINLSTVNSDRVEYWTDSPEENVSVIQYFFNQSDDLLEKNNVTKSEDNQSVSMKNVVFTTNDKTSWTGNSDLLTNVEEVVNGNNFALLFLSNDNKCYMRVCN